MTVFDKDKLFDKEKVGKSLDSTIWGTPPEIFDPINKEFRFTLDVCATKDNAKCAKFYTTEQNGLLQNWANEICWCNPPYGRDVVLWCKKALAESYNNSTTILLIPCKTNTNWWHDTVIPFAEIRFLRGRVKFVYSDGEQSKQALPWPLAFVIYKAKTAQNTAINLRYAAALKVWKEYVTEDRVDVLCSQGKTFPNWLRQRLNSEDGTSHS